MANICSTTIAIYSHKTDRETLEKFREDLLGHLVWDEKYQCFDHKTSGLSQIMKKYPYVPQDTVCAGAIENIGEIVEKNDHTFFEVFQNDRWGPQVDLWEEILREHKLLNFVYMAEEPGFEIYINSDESGFLYDVRFGLEISIEEDVFKECFPNGDWSLLEKQMEGIDGAADIFLSFKSEEDLLEFAEKLIGEKFITHEEFEDFLESVDWEDYPDIRIREYSID